MLWNRRRLGRTTLVIECDSKKLRRDQSWFVCIFIAKVALGLVVFRYKPWLGVLFLLAYGAYLVRELRGAQVLGEEELEPLKLHPTGDPGLLWPLLQTSLALLAIAIASKVFVGQLEAIGIWAGLSPQLVALLLSPVATELPETMNALIWVRQGKERLALGEYLRCDDDTGHRALRPGLVLHVVDAVSRADHLGSHHPGGRRGIARAVFQECGQCPVAHAVGCAVRCLRRAHRDSLTTASGH